MKNLKEYIEGKLISCMGFRVSFMAAILVILGLMISAMIPIALAATATNRIQDGPSDINDKQDLQKSLLYLKAHSADFGINDPYKEFRLRGIYRDGLGQTHVRLDQVYNEIPVFGEQLIVHFNSDGTPKSVNGAYQAGIDVSTLPKFSTSEAKEKAQKHFPGRFTRTEEPELVLYLQDENVVLVYRVALENDEPPLRIVAFIDANTGKKVHSYDDLRTPLPSVQRSDQLQTSPAISYINMIKPSPVLPTIVTLNTDTGTGYSLYSGEVNITTNLENDVYSMLDLSRGGLYTTDMEDKWKKKPGFIGTIFTDPDNVWGDSTNTDRATAGVDAHFGAEMTWDYYFNVHERNGVYNDGIGTLSMVHYGKEYNNAYWSDRCKCVTYGDGDGTMCSPLISLDIAGHEMTHGVTSAAVGLIYSGESGGLNEAMSDIFGTMIEFYASENGGEITPDYLIGEDIYTPSITGDALRYMDDPTRDNISIDNYSDYYSGMDVHFSSGIANKAFYLLAEGGDGIGRDNASKIFYRALTVYMIPSETFSQARNSTLVASNDLYGNVHNTSVENAWSAVGVE